MIPAVVCYCAQTFAGVLGPSRNLINPLLGPSLLVKIDIAPVRSALRFQILNQAEVAE